MGVAFLVLAGVLAWGAQDVTYSQALHDWELRRTPSDRIWEHSLASRGFSSPKDLKLIHSVLRKLPATLDLPGSVWMDRTASWVIVFSASEKTLPQRVFCLECKRPPEGFEPQGRGWAGYDRAHEAIEHMESRRIKPESPKKAHEFRDPRAIQY